MEPVNCELISTETKCGLCHQQRPRYTCPKCSIHYCTVTCYRSFGHVNCSENFFKECIVQELKSQQPKISNEKERSLKYILSNGMEEKENFDSDDDEDQSHQNLMIRLKNVDLNDSAHVWKCLKEKEKKEFQSLVISGDICNFLPKWNPWWQISPDNNVIVNKEDNCESLEIPSIPTEIPLLSSLMTKKPHQSVINGLLNILYGYAYVSRLFMQDWTGDTKPVIEILFDLSPILETSVLFSTPLEAIEDAKNSACTLFNASPELGKLIEVDVKHIVEQPKFVMASLSDINCLLLTGLQQKTGLKRRIFLATKKIEFYMSYVNEYGVSFLLE